MADDLKSRGPADRLRVNVNEHWELVYWSHKLGCTEAQLCEAVKAVGVMVDEIEAYLKRR